MVPTHGAESQLPTLLGEKAYLGLNVKKVFLRYRADLFNGSSYKISLRGKLSVIKRKK